MTEPTIISLPLRLTYAQIHRYPLRNLEGISLNNTDTQFYPSKELSIILDNFVEDTNVKRNIIFENKLFLASSDIFSYLRKNVNSSMYNDIITIVHPSFRDIYWRNRELLDMEDLNLLDSIITRPLPQFKNVFDYEYLSEYSDKINMLIYHLYGDITPFIVLHIKVKDFIETINNNEELNIKLKDINVVINLEYKPYDFYDHKLESVQQYISLSKDEYQQPS